jgi:hypothetical protein
MGSSCTPWIFPLTGYRQEDRTDGLLVFQHQQAGDTTESEKQLA